MAPSAIPPTFSMPEPGELEGLKRKGEPETKQPSHTGAPAQEDTPRHTHPPRDREPSRH